MVGSGKLSDTKIRTGVRGVSGIGTLLGALAILVLATGCPVVPPCTTNADCDDAVFCNGAETCVEGVCTAGTEPCEEGETCNEEADRCDVCEDAADCDDGDFCNGEETCVDGQCVAGTDPCPDDGMFCNGEETCDETTDMCESTGDPCEAGETCVESNDSCAAPCTTPADCPDDGDICTVDLCLEGVCVTSPRNCDDGDLCTTDSCDAADPAADPATGCVFEPVVCPDGQICNAATGVCEETPCTVDGDCDDTLFCTGVETCVDGLCVAGTNPCGATQTCDEANDVCVSPGNTFNLTTDDDALTGTTGDDTFVGTVGTLNPDDIVIGNGGDDALNATVAGTGPTGATLIDIDNVNFMTLNAVTFDASNATAIGAFNVAMGSTGNLTLDDLEEGIALGMGNNYNRVLTATLDNDAAATDELDLNLTGVDGAVFNYLQNTDPVETLNLDVMGTNTLEPADPGTDMFGDVDEVVVTGDGDLIFAEHDATDLDAHDWDAEDFTGMFWLSPIADSGDLAFNLTTGGNLAGFDDLDRYIINDTATHNHALTLEATDDAVTVVIESIDDGDLAGNLTVVRGSGDDDSLTVMLGGEGDGMGNIVAATTEFLTLDSSGDDENTVGAITLAGASSATPFVSEEVTITGDQDLTTGVVTADIIDASAFGAMLETTGSGDPNQFIGSPQDDTIDGAGGIDQIDAGDGDDTITGGAGADLLTGGMGMNTFIATTITASEANADLITDFVPGEDGDVFALDISALETSGAVRGGAVINFVELNDGTDVVDTDAVVIDEITVGGAATVIANANILVLVGGTIASSDALETALEAGGGTVLTVSSDATDVGDAFVVVYTDGTDGWVSICYATTETAVDTDFETTDLVCERIAQLQDIDAIAADDFVAENFDFLP